MKSTLLTLLILFYVGSVNFQEIQKIRTNEIIALLESDKPLAHSVINNFNLFEIDSVTGLKLLQMKKLDSDVIKNTKLANKLTEDFQISRIESNDSSLYNALNPLVSPNRKYIQLENKYNSVLEIQPINEEELNFYLSSYYGDNCTILLVCHANKGYYKMQRVESPLDGYGVVWQVELKEMNKLYIQQISLIKS
ncbi:hypothetical protein KDU71_17140 [Carboxylicivirga sediminis]|uniref:Uncharacterized protein n=1 Tax=Carboxylicivirga sediminis TaxID=2006564 RepID=A0A941J0B2_9BACT|nr:hypothetical protein [Carboxylicivirga sediminis]MBR8537297.1 hypothetical protein [Carboxylicivirga sediminis]